MANQGSKTSLAVDQHAVCVRIIGESRRVVGIGVAHQIRGSISAFTCSGPFVTGRDLSNEALELKLDHLNVAKRKKIPPLSSLDRRVGRRSPSEGLNTSGSCKLDGRSARAVALPSPRKPAKKNPLQNSNRFL